MSLAAVLPVSQEEARPPRPGLSARVRQAVWRVRGWLTRPHEFPLEIPDLVSPGLGRGGQTPRPGPPPNRSLPPAPPVSPSSAGWPTPPMNHVHGHVGVAVGLVSHSPAQGVTLRPESRELCELTERYARESRDSWGSWGGIGGGGPGVVASAMQGKGAGRTRGPVLGEADLERMGGKY